MSEKTFSPDIPGAAAWLQWAAGETPYGEVAVLIRLHEGRAPIIERTRTEKLKVSDGFTVGASREQRG